MSVPFEVAYHSTDRAVRAQWATEDAMRGTWAAMHRARREHRAAEAEKWLAVLWTLRDIRRALVGRARP